MQFVNQIAEVTHSYVDKYGGSANKNIGDAFLLVWKFPAPEEFQEQEQLIERKALKAFDPDRISKSNKQVADLSLFSFIKVISKINKYTHILEYRNDAEL